jgi:prepilin-type N-terminal cleavage/methylation domain-containing protein
VKFRPSGGFTLIEVLVSVVILAVGIVAVLEAFNVSLSLIGESRNVLRAHMLIMQKMAEIELSTIERPGRDPGSSWGTFDGANSDFSWESKVTEVFSAPFGVESAGKLDQVAVTVWREAGQRKYSAATYLRIAASEKGPGF